MKTIIFATLAVVFTSLNSFSLMACEGHDNAKATTQKVKAVAVKKVTDDETSKSPVIDQFADGVNEAAEKVGGALVDAAEKAKKNLSGKESRRAESPKAESPKAESEKK